MDDTKENDGQECLDEIHPIYKLCMLCIFANSKTIYLIIEVNTFQKGSLSEHIPKTIDVRKTSESLRKNEVDSRTAQSNSNTL